MNKKREASENYFLFKCYQNVDTHVQMTLSKQTNRLSGDPPFRNQRDQ